MVSVYSSDADVEADSPPPSRSDMTLSLRQHNLTMNICGTVYQLLRPYFVAAIREHPREPTASPHAQAFLAVFERSSVSLRIGVLYCMAADNPDDRRHAQQHLLVLFPPCLATPFLLVKHLLCRRLSRNGLYRFSYLLGRRRCHAGYRTLILAIDSRTGFDARLVVPTRRRLVCAASEQGSNRESASAIPITYARGRQWAFTRDGRRAGDRRVEDQARQAEREGGG